MKVIMKAYIFVVMSFVSYPLFRPIHQNLHMPTFLLLLSLPTSPSLPFPFFTLSTSGGMRASVIALLTSVMLSSSTVMSTLVTLHDWSSLPSLIGMSDYRLHIIGTPVSSLWYVHCSMQAKHRRGRKAWEVWLWDLMCQTDREYVDRHTRNSAWQ